MSLIESINLVNNSVISAIDKLNVKDGDDLIFYIKTDEEGNFLVPASEIQKFHDFIQKFLNQNFNNVHFLMIPDKIKMDKELNQIPEYLDGWVNSVVVDAMSSGALEKLYYAVNNQMSLMKKSNEKCFDVLEGTGFTAKEISKRLKEIYGG